MIDQGAVAFPSSAFTETFVEQIYVTLTVVPSAQQGRATTDGLVQILQSRITGGRRAARRVIDCLVVLGLVAETSGTYSRTSVGDRVRRVARSEGSAAIALALIRSGHMADQIRELRSVLKLTPNGYECLQSEARGHAPQLLGLLARLAGVAIGATISIGSIPGLELDSIWNELAPSARLDWLDIDKRRKAVGERAELYSMQFETNASLGARDRILWVSRDDDSLGYDIEVAEERRRCIEVKGTSGREVQFFVTSNEYDVASRYGDDYEIQFWGMIDLRTDPPQDYERLRGAGYPVRVRNPVQVLHQEPWRIAPDRYRVTVIGDSTSVDLSDLSSM